MQRHYSGPPHARGEAAPFPLMGHLLGPRPVVATPAHTDPDVCIVGRAAPSHPSSGWRGGPPRSACDTLERACWERAGKGLSGGAVGSAGHPTAAPVLRSRVRDPVLWAPVHWKEPYPHDCDRPWAGSGRAALSRGGLTTGASPRGAAPLHFVERQSSNPGPRWRTARRTALQRGAPPSRATDADRGPRGAAGQRPRPSLS